jgi:di/tricarboxylate transporter
VEILELLRNERKIWSPTYEPLAAGDVLLVRGRVKDLMDLRASVGLHIAPEFELKDDTLQREELTLVEALVSPRSRLVGQRISESDFRWRFDAIVLALQRQGHLLRDKLSQVRLGFGDALLLLTRKENVSRLRSSENLLVLGEVDAPSLRNGRALLALGILTAAVLLASFKVMPILMSAILGCLALITTRCLTLEEAYKAIDWQVIFLLAAILPMGLVLERSGGASWLADHALKFVGPFGPLAVLAVLYLLTAVLTEVMSNTAAAVLLAPIAISTAVNLGVDPKPFLLAVTFAASTSFATPVGYQTNTMVYNAGSYRFSDFMKVGVPLNLIFWLLAVWLIPKLWPF